MQFCEVFCIFRNYKIAKMTCKFVKCSIFLETMKLLEEKIGKTFSDINHSRILCDPPPRVMEIKAKINKSDLIKLKSFCTVKETINKVKRQPPEWEKIITKQLTINLKNIQAAQVAQYQKNSPIKKWAKELDRHFSKEDIDG